MITEEILNLAKNGNEEAMEQILIKHKGIIYKNIHLLFLKGADFEDLIQEGFIGLLKAIKYYDSNKDASFTTFANLCIKRHMISIARNANIKKYKILNDAISEEYYCNQEEKITYKSSLFFSSPEEIFLGKELSILLINHLNITLSYLEKQVFYYFIRQYSYTEIATLLNKSPKHIDNTIQRIKKKIRSYLENYKK